MEPKDLILPAALALGGFFVVRTVMSRRAEAAATLPSSGGGKELPSGGGGGGVSGGGGSSSSGRHIPQEASNRARQDSIDLQRHLNSIRSKVRGFTRNGADANAAFPWEHLTVDGVVGLRTRNAYDMLKASLENRANDGAYFPRRMPELNPNNEASIRTVLRKVGDIDRAVGIGTQAKTQALTKLTWLLGGR